MLRQLTCGSELKPAHDRLEHRIFLFVNCKQQGQKALKEQSDAMRNKTCKIWLFLFTLETFLPCTQNNRMRFVCGIFCTGLAQLPFGLHFSCRSSRSSSRALKTVRLEFRSSWKSSVMHTPIFYQDNVLVTFGKSCTHCGLVQITKVLYIYISNYTYIYLNVQQFLSSVHFQGQHERYLMTIQWKCSTRHIVQPEI